MSSEETRRFLTYKWSTFVSLYAGYTLIVLNRKSFSFALPAVIQEGHLAKDDLGLITSSQNLAYTISKFVGGLLSDTVSSRLLFCGGLLFTGIITCIFTGFDNAYIFAFLWFLQGFVQGGSWPACAKILKEWCSKVDFGTWYAVLNTSMNCACSIGPVLTAYLIQKNTWESCLFNYGTLALGCAMVCFVTVSNTPTEVGCQPPVGITSNRGSKGRGRGTWYDMLFSPFMWILFVSYCVVYIGRTAAVDWAQLYLIQERGQSQYMGSIFLSLLEVGGIVGSVIAGYSADRLVAMSKREDTRGTPRMTIVIGFICVYIASLHCMIFTISQNTHWLWISLVAFGLGMGIYGPVALYGVMAIESAPTHLSGTSHAIVALSANIGAILAGLPFSFVAKHFEWKGAFMVLEVLLVCVLIIKLATRNVEYKMVPIKKKLH